MKFATISEIQVEFWMVRCCRCFSFDLLEFLQNILPWLLGDSVDGRNPAPPGMYETLQIVVYLPYQLVQDFFHQPH